VEETAEESLRRVRLNWESAWSSQE